MTIALAPRSHSASPSKNYRRAPPSEATPEALPRIRRVWSGGAVTSAVITVPVSADVATSWTISCRDPSDMVTVRDFVSDLPLLGLAGLLTTDDSVPTTVADEIADLVLREASSAGLEPSRVAPTEDGGIVIYFFGHGPQRYAALECYEGGELVLVHEDRPGKFRKVEEIDPTPDDVSEALTQIQRFLDPSSWLDL